MGFKDFDLGVFYSSSVNFFGIKGALACSSIILSRIGDVLSWEEIEGFITRETHFYLVDQKGYSWDGDEKRMIFRNPRKPLSHGEYLEARAYVASCFFKRAMNLARSPSFHKKVDYIQGGLFSDETLSREE